MQLWHSLGFLPSHAQDGSTYSGSESKFCSDSSVGPAIKRRRVPINVMVHKVLGGGGATQVLKGMKRKASQKGHLFHDQPCGQRPFEGQAANAHRHTCTSVPPRCSGVCNHQRQMTAHRQTAGIMGIMGNYGVCC